MTARDLKRRAILTRAATVEVERQAAHAAKDWHRALVADMELRRLWARHAALERQVASLVVLDR